MGRITLPEPEGKTVQTSLRMPEKLMARLDRIAKESGHERTTVILHFLRWACDEYEAQPEDVKRPKKG